MSDIRKPATVAAVIGFNVGMYWIFVVQPSPPSELFWGRIIRVSCPAVVTGRAPLWLVPILNAVVYAIITLVIGFFMRLVRPFLR